MKAQELRIGNYIGCDGNILIVEKIDIQNNIGCSLLEKSKGLHVNSGNKYFIPLTEEWLFKFGYKQTAKDFFVDETRLNIWREPKNFNGFLADWADTTIGEVKHVHQLQNLYFALTGEELTLKNNQYKNHNHRFINQHLQKLAI